MTLGQLFAAGYVVACIILAVVVVVALMRRPPHRDEVHEPMSHVGEPKVRPDQDVD